MVRAGTVTRDTLIGELPTKKVSVYFPTATGLAEPRASSASEGGELGRRGGQGTLDVGRGTWDVGGGWLNNYLSISINCWNGALPSDDLEEEEEEEEEEEVRGRFWLFCSGSSGDSGGSSGSGSGGGGIGGGIGATANNGRKKVVDSDGGHWRAKQ
ncbi:hypothetical protein EMCG_05379 [[Emmonsia] crescens]|uniref:Uncharacterized protein n=1 Tax=[Emmonsia] crescens TaxID=73230 RepID=A0A0G2HP15_9EURO|nr:hypothetical protein EMCG_05379 [Emmonsia crescens UAMH 3008]